jgi:hypothetical protein
VSATTTRQVAPDQACADAVDLARAAAEEDAGPGLVGAHVGMDTGGDRVVTHLFASLSPGYVGWRWAVTVTRAARAKVVTVSESVLLPGPDALLAPEWVPWTQRVRPGDLKAGDLMPARSDDERLVPVVALAGDTGLLDWDDSDAWRLAGQAGPSEGTGPGEGTGPAETAAREPADDAAGEVSDGAANGPVDDAAGQQANALATDQGRPDQPKATSRARTRRRSSRSRVKVEPVGMLRPARVLSAAGRDEAAGRWYAGEHGPQSALASTAPATCLTCGFMIRLSGPLGRVFGVCANEYAPDDGKVVSVDHGCGAHSEGAVSTAVSPEDTTSPAIDELGYDMLQTGATLPDSVLETMDHELL